MAIPVVAVGNVLKVRIFCHQLSQISVNVQYWNVTIASGDPEMDGLAAEISNTWSDDYRACMANTATFLGVALSRIIPTPATVEYLSQEGTGAGTASGFPMPAQVCGMISVSNDTAGPKYRARNYIPFPAAVFSSGDETPSAAYLALLDNLVAKSLLQEHVWGGNVATLERRLYPGATAPNEMAAYAKFRDKWATQKRRGDYGQPNVSPF